VFYYEHFTDALKAMPTHPKGTALFNQQTGAEITQWETLLKKRTLQFYGAAQDKSSSSAERSGAKTRPVIASTSTASPKRKTKHVGLSSAYLRIK
jgi:hypothetical protein